MENSQHDRPPVDFMSFFLRKRGCSSPGGSNRKARSLAFEALESRSLLAADIFLDYGDGSAANDFKTRLDELAASLGILPVTSAEVTQVKVALKVGLQTAFSQFTVNFLEALPAG